MKMFLSFVIPCYKSEFTIKDVIYEIYNKMEERPNIDYEIITVNDCSPDKVLDVLGSLAKDDTKIKVIDLAKNSGKHAAVMAGCSVAEGNIIVNLDDDGQCPIDKLWELLTPLEEGYDVSIARYPHKKQSAFKNFGSKLASAMDIYLLNKPKGLQTGNFLAIKRFVVKNILMYKNPYPYLSGLILQCTSKITNVDMEERERVSGKGNFTLKKSFSLLLNGFTAFSVKPLRFATILGFFVALAGFIFGLTIIIRKIIQPEIPAGYSSTMAVLLFIGGMIMLMLGLIGEYIGRIYICINNSPQYVIKNTINIQTAEDSDRRTNIEKNADHGR